MIVLGVSLFVGGALIILGPVLGFNVLPDIVEEEIAKSVRLEKGTEQYERWEKLPFALSFKVYLFNVENPDEVMVGLNPVVRQVGPFAYKQKRNKIDIESENNGNTLSYNQMQNYEFDADNSGPGITTETEVTLFNVPLYGIFQNAEFAEGTPLTVVNLGHGQVFPNSETMFHKVNAHDYLLGNGYPICRPADISRPPNPLYARMLCTTITSQAALINTMEVTDNGILFAFFRYKNGNHDGRYKIHSGMDDVKKTGSIQSWNDQEYQNVWVGEDSACNKVEGTDASVYPPHQDKNKILTVFSSDICRTVQLKFEKDSEYKGIDGYQSRLMPDSFNNDESKECYCTKKTKNLNGDNICLPNGFVDMFNCLRSQIVLSFPHLLYADPEYARTVTGLSPDPDLHATYVELQPDSGSPLKGAKRVQFNMFMRPLGSIIKASTLPHAVMPILWVEEGTDLPDDLVQKIKDDLISKLDLVEGLKWGLLAAGIVIFVIAAGVLIYKTCFDKVRTLR